MAAVLDPATEQEYLALVHAFPLVSIRDDAHLADALVIIDRLIEQPERSAAEEAYLGALTDLVETYEHAHVAIPPVSGVDALRYLMEENGLTQADLAPLFGSPSIVSEVLSGKRRLAISHIQKLAAHFGVPADVFLSYPTVSSLAGAAGSLEQPVSWDKMRDIAREDRQLEAKTKRP